MINLDYLNEFPPLLIRLVARKPGMRGVPLTNEDIADSSDMDISDIQRISRLMRWNKVTFEEAERFCNACGVTYANIGVHRAYLRRAFRQTGGRFPLAHLHRLVEKEKKFVEELISILKREG